MATMAQTNVLKRYLDAGVAFTTLTQSKAEALVKDLVKTGEVQTEQAQAAVLELVERSRKNTEAFIDQVRKEIAASAESLGLATIADVTRLEKLIATMHVYASSTPEARELVAELEFVWDQVKSNVGSDEDGSGENSPPGDGGYEGADRPRRRGEQGMRVLSPGSQPVEDEEDA